MVLKICQIYDVFIEQARHTLRASLVRTVIKPPNLQRGNACGSWVVDGSLPIRMRFLRFAHSFLMRSGRNDGYPAAASASVPPSEVRGLIHSSGNKNNSTIQQFNSSTTQRFNNSTVKQSILLTFVF
jgi:hypothetical protein